MGPTGARGSGRRQPPGAELLSHRRISSRLSESPLGSHSPGFLLSTDGFADRRDAFVSCDRVDTLPTVCVFVCVFVGGGSDRRRGPGGGGHVRTDPRVQGDQRERSEAEAASCERVDKGDILLRRALRGGVAFAIIRK